MKKIKENPELDTGSVKLYLDDILSIVESMQEVEANGELEITVGGYQFSSTDELAELNQKEHQSICIVYKTSTLYSTARFLVSKKYAHLSYSSIEDSLALRGAFANIERIILTHRRKWDWVFWFFYGAMCFGMSVSIFLLLGKVNQSPVMTYIGFGIAAVMLIALAMFLFTIPVRASKIILADKIEHDTFWKQNKDTVIVTAISSTISFILGVLGTLLVQVLSK